MIMDIFPTIAELIGTEKSFDYTIDGISLVLLLLNHQKLPKRSLFWESMNQECVRDGQWKL